MRKQAFQILVLSILLYSCNKNETPVDVINHRQEMRNFVAGISEYSKAISPNFQVIPQNGIELITQNGEANGELDFNYLNAVDGFGQEDLFYGYEEDNQATPIEENNYLIGFLDLAKNQGKTILVTDYCSSISNMDDSYFQNNNKGYVSFSASHRELNNIPDYQNQIFQENNTQISKLPEIKNFLYLINPENYTSKTEFIGAITSSNYDLLIMDLFFKEDIEFTSAEIEALKYKANGGKRLVISYLSIGEAENYRYYWDNSWNNSPPSWLEKENSHWKGNYKVKFWDANWKDIIYGNENSYLKKIIDANFDGVFLDIIDAYEYFE